jgi:hypothetical protein
MNIFALFGLIVVATVALVALAWAVSMMFEGLNKKFGPYWASAGVLFWFCFVMTAIAKNWVNFQ